MFIPPAGHNKKQQQTKLQTSQENPLCLRNKHLVLHHSLTTKIFRDDTVICIAYYPRPSRLLLAPYQNENFRNIHKVKQYMLKEVGREESAIAIHGILIDHDLPEQDCFPEFEAMEVLNVLTVYLPNIPSDQNTHTQAQMD